MPSTGARLAELYLDRLGHPCHPLGGLLLAPELNAVLWAFPFDPAMPSLDRCLDGEWNAVVLRRRSPAPLRSELVRYDPEVGAVFAYREPARGRVVAYGKDAPQDSCGLVYLVMDRLWRSPARRTGQLHLARPLAFRPQAGLLLQTPVGGRPVSGERNRTVFLKLVEHAASALAAIHRTDIPFGPQRSLDSLIARLEAGLATCSSPRPASTRPCAASSARSRPGPRG